MINYKFRIFGLSSCLNFHGHKLTICYKSFYSPLTYTFDLYLADKYSKKDILSTFAKSLCCTPDEILIPDNIDFKKVGVNS